MLCVRKPSSKVHTGEEDSIVERSQEGGVFGEICFLAKLFGNGDGTTGIGQDDLHVFSIVVFLQQLVNALMLK